MREVSLQEEELLSQGDDEQYEHEFYMDAITARNCSMSIYEPPWLVPLPILNSTLNFKVDSGADVTIISDETFEKLKKREPSATLRPSYASLKNANKGLLNNIGQFQTETVFRNEKYLMNIHVVENTNNLLSRGDAKRMGILHVSLDEIEDRYHNVFGDDGRMKGDPVEIKIDADAEPYHVSAARRVPYPLLNKVKAELERMEAAGIIEKITEPTPWCSPLVVTMKKNNQVRLCIDLRQLNRVVKRERYILPTIDDIMARLAGMKVFSKLDATGGYHQMPLNQNSTKLTTFITPHGRFCFKRMPFGISSASEIFQRKLQEFLGDIKGVAHYQDDIIVAGETIKEHDRRLQEVLQKLQDAGVKLNKQKCSIRKDTVNYLGHRIDKDGVHPEFDKIKAINELKPPTNVPELRRVLGMVKYLGRFVPEMARIIQPMNENLKSETTWTWGPDQQGAFCKAKELITNAPVLAFYDVSKPTVVSADSSSYGIGAVLMQSHDNQLRPVAFASRTLTETEQKYAQIEKECLASVWACEKFDRYILGLPSFRLLTDHKPLVPLINGTDLNKVPLRCQRLLMRLMRYRPTAEHVKGKDMWVSDTLSRQPLKLTVNDIENIDEIEQFVADVRSHWPMSDRRLVEMQKATADDATLQAAINYTVNGWPIYGQDVPNDVKDYFNERTHLSVAQGLLIYDDRIVIPSSKRREVLQCIHEGHLGIDKCRDRASTGVWWPRITLEVKNIVKACEHCQIHKKAQQKESLHPTPLPDGPWKQVATDILEEKGVKHIVVVDQYSRYLELMRLYGTTSSAIIQKLKGVFARWGIPLKLVSDNGPQFSAKEFADFAENYGFEHHTTSPHHHQANGAAEKAVQTAKKILKQKDPFLALMTYRATPVKATGYSPAQLAMGRQIRTRLPVLQSKMNTEWPKHSEVQRNDERAKSTYSHYYRRGNHIMPDVKIGENVRIKTDEEKQWSAPAKVVGKPANAPRSVLVRCQNGNVVRRNRRHVQCIPNTHAQTSPNQRASYTPMQRASQHTPIQRVAQDFENQRVLRNTSASHTPPHSAVMHSPNENALGHTPAQCTTSPVHASQLPPTCSPTPVRSPSVNTNRPPANRPTDHQITTSRAGRVLRKPARFNDYVCENYKK